MEPSAIAQHVTDVSARGIAAAVGSLIRSGRLPVGTKLPTVRVLARELGVSPATVSQAWRLLSESRTIETRGKAGTIVAAVRPQVRPRSVVDAAAAALPIDLSTSLPDPALLPDLAPALAAAAAASRPNSYGRQPILPRLREVVTPDWPFPPARMLAVNGGFDGVMAVCASTLRYGDRVLVENPTASRLLDILEFLRVEPTPIDCDENGPLPDSLSAALAANPTMLLIQPRAHEPTGHALTADRAAALADILRDSGLIIVEDDGKPALSTAAPVSLGTYLPDRTVLIRSYSKSHGLDLRVGLVGGAAGPVEAAQRRHTFSGGWTSYLLQETLAHLLTDEDTRCRVKLAREIYADRRRRFAAVLADHEIAVANRDGLGLWVPVPHQQTTLLALAARGINATPGTNFTVGRARRPHLRIVPSRLGDDLDEVAATVAEVISGGAGSTVSV